MELSLDELKGKLESYLGNRLGGTARIDRMFSLSGGACQDNYLVDLEMQGGNEPGNYELVMRTDKGGALLSSLNRVDEFAVVKMAHDSGVFTPQPYWLEADANVIGNPFYFMQRIQGKATGRYVVRDKSLNDYRKKLAPELAASLARIHAVTPENCTDQALRDRLFSSARVGDATAESRVAVFREWLAELPDAHPAIELALNWLEKNAPETDQLVLVHGDFRTGNFMVSPEGLHGIVDWEFAHWGDRHEDISWLCMRDWRFGKNNRPVGGFALRKDFYEAYEKESGAKVDEQKVLYWEVIGNVGWALGAAQQGERHISGADRGIEFASIGRRVCEMEYEMMRLIESAG